MLQKYCCFRLESTAKFIGWWGTIFSVLLTIFSILGIVFAQKLVKSLNIRENEVQIVCYILMVMALINAGAHISLLLSVYQKRHNLVLVWLIANALLMVCLIIPIFFGLYGNLILLALNIHLWIAMFSLYKRIKSER